MEGSYERLHHRRWRRSRRPSRQRRRPEKREAFSLTEPGFSNDRQSRLIAGAPDDGAPLSRAALRERSRAIGGFWQIIRTPPRKLCCSPIRKQRFQDSGYRAVAGSNPDVLPFVNAADLSMVLWLPLQRYWPALFPLLSAEGSMPSASDFLALSRLMRVRERRRGILAKRDIGQERIASAWHRSDG